MDKSNSILNSKNPVLITYGISKILETVRKKISKNINDVSKITELDWLFMMCKSDNLILSSVSSQAIVSLVDNGLLTISETLSKFVAILGETKNHCSSTSAICNLLVLNFKTFSFAEDYHCPFSISAPQHPLITVMTLKKDSWRYIIGHMQSMIQQSDSEYLTHYVELLRPVFMYIICSPTSQVSESCRQRTWQLLIKTPCTLHLQLDILQWLRTNNFETCIDTNTRILELSEVLISTKNIEYCTAISLLIMTCTLELLKLNCDIRPNITIMESIIEYVNPDVANIIMYLIAEMIVISPAIHLSDAINLGVMVFDKLNCDRISVHSFIGSILPWMAYANSLSSNALDTITNFIQKIAYKSCWINSKKELYSNQIFSTLRHVHHSIQFYAEICSHMETWKIENFTEWLRKLLQASESHAFKYRIILCGIFLNTNNLTIFTRTREVLCRIIKKFPNYANNVMSLILYKLSKSCEVRMTNELLFMIPEMAVTKENLPIIIHTLESFLVVGDPLEYIAIELYLRAWKIEPRYYRYLLSALINISKKDLTRKGKVTCANAMKFICECRPESGVELVPLLSYILNDATDSAASALALRGISALCISGVADVYSTWQVLSPKMNKEQRSIVIKSMCEFFIGVSVDTTYSDENREQLLRQVLKKLWEFASLETIKNTSIVQSAFRALSVYTLEQMQLIDLPISYRNSLKPLKNTFENCKDESRIESSLSFIPGSCWINMLQVIHEDAKSIAGDFIIKLISDELYSFRTGIYTWPMGEPVDFKYLPEKSAVKAIGEFLRRYKYPSSSDVQKVILECLRIYSHKYLKPLPPIKFEIFDAAIKISDEAWTYGISLACHQSIVSPSAREFLSNYIKETTKKISSTEELDDRTWKLCTHLEDICRAITSNIVGPFIDVTTNYILQRAIVGIEKSSSMFKELMDKYSKTLNNDLVHHDNKTAIANVLEKLFNIIEKDKEIFNFLVNALVELPIEKIERMTLPSVWDRITNDKLEKAIAVRAGLVLKRDNEIPLSWMNGIIRVAAPISGVHECLLQCMKTIQSQLKHEKSNASWCWDLMCEIQAMIQNKTDDKSIESAKFLSDLLFITLITEASENCLIDLTDDTSIIISHTMRTTLFPGAIFTLSTMPFWKSIIQQIMEWLHFMRTSVLPISYKIAYHNSLISLKNERYLNDNWTTYLSIKSTKINK